MNHRGMNYDLIVLVADADAEWTVRTLIEKRSLALGIRTIRTFVIRHPQRDAGVYSQCHEFLRQFLDQAMYALVMLDHEGSGREGQTPEEIETKIEERLVRHGWARDHVAAIVLDPELEIWVWSPSPHVARIIGIEQEQLAMLLEREPTNEAHKPTRPKEVLERALRKSKRPFSARIFQELAERVSLRTCQDRAFGKFSSTLQQWFPPNERDHL